MRIPIALAVVGLGGTLCAQQSWVPLGPDDADWPSLSSVVDLRMVVDPLNNPVVAFRDQSTNARATVRRWTGAVWMPVGNAGFSAGVANDMSLALDSSGQPVVAYADDANGGRAT